MESRSMGDLLSMDLGTLIEETWPEQEERYMRTTADSPFDGNIKELDEAESEHQREHPCEF